MTLGTGIVISVAIICGTFILLCGMGMKINADKQKAKSNTQLSQTVIDAVREKLKRDGIDGFK